jgi:SAM-dependent methyltransferase
MMTAVRALAKRILRRGSLDYREALFVELRTYLDGSRPSRILEIGPKDGHDTRRLLGLEPKTLTLIDLPRMQTTNEQWLSEMDRSRIEYVSANFMYSQAVRALDPYDCIWCTGVLYHNPEQLRMIRRLWDLLKPGGVLVLESAVTRRRTLQGENCVEIIYPPSEAVKRKYHLSFNITHLPSSHAIASWLAMTGFEDVTRAHFGRQMAAALASTRAAFLARKPLVPKPGAYYAFPGEPGFEIGSAL